MVARSQTRTERLCPVSVPTRYSEGLARSAAWPKISPGVSHRRITFRPWEVKWKYRARPLASRKKWSAESPWFEITEFAGYRRCLAAETIVLTSAGTRPSRNRGSRLWNGMTPRTAMLLLLFRKRRSYLNQEVAPKTIPLIDALKRNASRISIHAF